MGKNEIGQLKNFIQVEARANHVKPDRHFVRWYAEMRRETEETPFRITDGGDGEIDLVIEQKASIVLAQLKFRKASIHDLRAFEKTIDQWSDEKKFHAWLEHDVANHEFRREFRRAFSVAKQEQKELLWEFVSLSSHNDGWVDKLKSVGKDYPGLMRAETVSAQYLLFLHELERIGAKYVDQIDFQVEPSHLEVRHPKGFRTVILAIKLPALLGGLRRHGNADALLARNVRLEIPNSTVNAGIAATYTKEPHKFFFGNNGVHVITTQAQFIGDKMVLEQPAIINGGQTIKSLLSSNARHRDGEVLLRVTEIPREFQSLHEGRDFVGDIIFMSNNNNKMEPWNLRSNDPVQVAIAKHFHRNKIFYERKDYEWRQSKFRQENHDISVSIHSTDLAAAIACADDSINPVGLKEMGIAPLFVREAPGGGKKAYYSRIFGRLDQRLDEALSMARLSILVDKWAPRTPGIPDDFSGFPRASANFVFGIIWRALEDGRFRHPYRLMPAYRKSCKNMGRIVRRLVKGLFDEFVTDMRHGVQQNDIFRGKSYWKEALRKFTTNTWRKDIRLAAQRDMRGA